MTRLCAILAALWAATLANAQCVMCYRTAAAQEAERAKVLNFGIIIMLIPPFLILGGFLYLAYRRRASFYGDDEPGQDALAPEPFDAAPRELTVRAR